MRRTLTTALLTMSACLAIAGQARSDTWIVTGTGDSASAPGCTEIQPTMHQCPMFRSAVNEVSEAGGDGHVIGLPTGTLELTQGQLIVDTDVTIAGNGARATTVDAGLRSRVFMIASGASVSMTNFTVANGNVNTGDGGNVLVSAGGGLLLQGMRVTGGVANRGAGIFNNGTVVAALSLLDDNNAQANGGAIANVGGAQVQVINATLAGNYASAGAAISSFDGATNQVQLVHATVARNISAPFWFQHATGTSVNASIIGPNGGTAACDPLGQGFAGGASNVDTGASCGLPAASNRLNTNPGVAEALTNQGGGTDVLTIPAGSPAVDLVPTCSTPTDQRGFTRVSAPGTPCDAGAYEQSAVGVPQEPPPPPEPTPVPVVQPPVPTPVFQQSVVAAPVSGRIRVRRPGSRRFVELTAGQAIPLGSTVDAKAGVVEIASVPKAGGKPETAQFRQGIFRVTQSRGITDLKLVEQLAPCPKRKARTAAKKPKSRKLWGKGKGAFRTTGNYSAATVRGTEWLVQDTCAGTLTRVTEGVVSVRDKVKKRTFLLRAPRSYTAKPRRR
jgi:hypothetical protein